MSPATSPSRAMAMKTGPRCDASRRNGHSGGQRSSMHAWLDRRLRREAVTGRLLSRRETIRFGEWNVRTLRRSGKTEQVALAMKQYRLSCVAVTETHLTGADEMVLDAHTGYSMIFSGRKDTSNAEGVKLALTPHARAALRRYQAVSSQILKAELLTQAGPLLMIVAYTPTDQSSMEDKDQFSSDLDCVITTANGLTIVMGDFNAAIGESVQGVVGCHGLTESTSDNGKRLMSFASVHGLCITNTMFPTNRFTRQHSTHQIPMPNLHQGLRAGKAETQTISPGHSCVPRSGPEQ